MNWQVKMKMTKDDIRELKNKHRLELVMQESGEVFEPSSADPDHWLSTITPGLSVDIRRQIYEIKQPGKDESGDVIAWLKRRYSWNFGMVIKFLQKRSADPKRQNIPPSKKTKKPKKANSLEGKSKPIDQWQQRALEIGGERIRKYFSWSHWDLILYTDETRIEPAYAPDITACQRCERKLDWLKASENSLAQIPVAHGYQLQRVGPIPIIVYSIKRRLKISDLGLSGNEQLEDAFDQLTDELGALFAEEEDGIVCEKCAWDEYDLQIALSLCRRSARIREQAEEEEQRKRAMEDWLESERQKAREQEELISAWESENGSPV
jgi:hypothetical protein